jgi:pyruvate formate lyase activating enzyme
MVDGMVFKINRYALHDGPGIRTTVFLKGCPLSCWWCHNPEGILPQAQVMGDEPVGLRMSVKQVLAEIEKDVVFYDQSSGGVTFSGGEPASQPQFLEELLRACRKMGIHTALDTSGHAPAGVFLGVAGLADLVLFDLKIMDRQAHRRYTGVDNQLILGNFWALCRAKKCLTVRFPLVPELTDTPENIDALAAFVSRGQPAPTVDILPFHRSGGRKYEKLGMIDQMAAAPAASKQSALAAQARLQSHGLAVRIGGCA